MSVEGRVGSEGIDLMMQHLALLVTSVLIPLQFPSTQHPQTLIRH